MIKMYQREREKIIYHGIKQRCLNPNNKRYPLYGGRGITICDEWVADYSVFLNDMGRRPSSKHSIERIDNDKGYCKENCRWATQKEQMNNTRNTQILFLKGTKVTMTELIDISGFSQATLWNRINRIGMSVEDAIKKPIMHNRGILLNGERYRNLCDIAQSYKIDYGALYARIQTMTLEKAVSIPYKMYKNNSKNA